MDVSIPRRMVNRRFFVGCSAVSALPLVAFGKPEPQGFVPRNELELRVSGWLGEFTGPIHVCGYQRGVPVCLVGLNQKQWSGFYRSLAENFPSPRIGKNNLVELRSGSHSVWLRVA